MRDVSVRLAVGPDIVPVRQEAVQCWDLRAEAVFGSIKTLSWEFSQEDGKPDIYKKKQGFKQKICILSQAKCETQFAKQLKNFCETTG